ncbi:trafficking protein particle complex subunit 8 [Culicoides brevitarsis]|uniref:trafficking protein particle complex subunit 8 n=1 Tax=Culicoides brevitarsis TaxID=469753 RepID=UPI00307B35D1
MHTPKEIIQNEFMPRVAVICSASADEICMKNNLSFVEMLQPYCRLTTDAHFRDNSGVSVSVKGISINFADVDSRPPQTMLARKLLNESVATTTSIDSKKMIKVSEDLTIDIPEPCSWFEQWREIFFSVQFPADHEFTRHFLSCLIVVSNSDPNPLESATQLTSKIQMMLTAVPPRLPKWFSTDVLNCYVMLHDGRSSDLSQTQQGFESLKAVYGENKCFLLQINNNENPQTDIVDVWHKFIKRQQKGVDSTTNASGSDLIQTERSLPDVPVSITPPDTLNVDMGPHELIVAHPLSPMTETGQDILQNSSMVDSSESLTQPKYHKEIKTISDPNDSIHGQFLSSADLDNLRHFVQDYTIRALIPFVEKLVGILNESIANKKGVSRSLLSATKRWFVTNKPAIGTGQNSIAYTQDSTELQTRKLGDLYFMFGNYMLAFQAYHQAKRDFNADSAWQYYAGALEMAALSAFMQGQANRKTYDYMEEAIVTYLNYCKMPQFATRATLLSLECLKAAKMYSEACRQLTRMTSEDSDLRSALLLEQAAYCYISTETPQFRKYAFHMVLAAHRYQRAGQRKHSYRAHKMAYEVYRGKIWNLAVDHVLHTVGKQAMALKKLDEASTLFAHLLRPSAWKDAEKQTLFFGDYISAQKALLSNQEETIDVELLDVAIPVIDQSSVKVLVTSRPPVANPLFVPASNITINSSLNNESKWNKLEEMVSQYASPKPIMVFKPNRALFSHEYPALNDSPLCVHGEPVEICFTLENTIKPQIIFEEIHLLWEFVSDNEDKCRVTNKNLFKLAGIDIQAKEILDNVITAIPVSRVDFDEYERKRLVMKVTPKQTGTLKIVGVAGRLSCPNETSGSLWGKLMFESNWIKINDKKVELDKKLEIQVLPPAPALHVSFSQTPEEVLAGEVIPIMINLTNAGTSPIGDVFIASENPRWISVNPEEADLPLSVLRDFRNLSNDTFHREKEARKQHVFKLFKSNEPSVINPMETKTSSIWLQTPYQKGKKEICILIYYAMSSDYPKLRYRLVRHIWKMNVHESINVGAECNIGSEKNELAIDIQIKNMNQVHHALMTNIMVSNIHLFCRQYDLDSDKVIFLNSPSYNRILKQNDETGLKSDEAIALRIPLKDKKIAVSKESVQDFLKTSISEMVVRKIREAKNQLPELTTSGSFLLKHETKFIDVFEKGMSAEDFSNIISKPDRHMTLCLSWKAIVNDGGTIQRSTFGQHFIQLRNISEIVFCPLRERLQTTTFVQEAHHSIYDIQRLCDDDLDVSNNETDWEANSSWAVHNVNVAQRCFIEYEVQITDMIDGKTTKIF